MKIKTSELTGAALDYVVAKVMVASGVFTEDAYEFGTGRPYFNTKAVPCLWGCGVQKANWLDLETGNPQVHHGSGGTYSPSTNWANGGPLIDEYIGAVSGPTNARSYSIACLKGSVLSHRGETILIAVCRAVASKLGDEVEVPDELLEAA